MSGAWELKEGRSVLVGILHVDTTTVAWALGLRNLRVPGQILPVAGMPYDMARNHVCRIALEQGFEWVFMLDSDVIPPNDAILRLISRKKPLISGMYCRRSPPHGMPVAIKNGTWLTQFKPNSIVEVDYVGAGCLLIHRTILEQLTPSDPARGKTFFDWRVDMAGILPQGEALSEDFEFCRQVKLKLGVPTLLDTSIVCRHVGNAQALPGMMLPLETSPIT